MSTADRTVITIEDLTIEVTRKRMRYLRVSVDLRTSRIRISAPRRTSVRDIVEFARSRVAWIRKYLAQAKPPAPGLDALGELGVSAQRERAAGNRREIQLALPAIVAKWECAIGVRASAVRVRRMRSRWGSCNPRTGAISISSELAEHSRESLEYVVVHELVHLLEASHNRRFYELMSRFLPSWRVIRAQLNGRSS
ncbi:MAG TPA: YgjP-like metallopeptidase domain-containing protein [Gemmatimonadaceae bacterium]|nr:YgjP-like metallopeptidase domain-containing protein [Gemmatimonadaceae bacterium]